MNNNRLYLSQLITKKEFNDIRDLEIIINKIEIIKKTMSLICLLYTSSVPAIQYGHVSDHALMIETIFEEEENLVAGNLFFLPDLSSFDKILMALGVK